MCSVALILALGPTVQVMYISYAMKPCGPNCVDTLAHFMGGLYGAYIVMDTVRILGLTAGVFTTTAEERNAGSASVNTHMRKYIFERPELTPNAISRLQTPKPQTLGQAC